MDRSESPESVLSRELIAFAHRQGMDLATICHSGGFLSDGRVIFLWRKDGIIQYNLQGTIGLLPERFKASAHAFRGMWHEVGTFENIEQALVFLKAWLIDKKEVDDLPMRCVRSHGIG